MTVMKDLLRKYGEHADEVLPRLQAHLQHVQGNGQAKAAMVWMLGEYGENIPESPYLLEAIIEDIAEEDSPDVRLQLLTATMKLFFKRYIYGQTTCLSILFYSEPISHFFFFIQRTRVSGNARTTARTRGHRRDTHGCP